MFMTAVEFREIWNQFMVYYNKHTFISGVETPTGTFNTPPVSSRKKDMKFKITTEVDKAKAEIVCVKCDRKMVVHSTRTHMIDKNFSMFKKIHEEQYY